MSGCIHLKNSAGVGKMHFGMNQFTADRFNMEARSVHNVVYAHTKHMHTSIRIMKICCVGNFKMLTSVSGVCLCIHDDLLPRSRRTVSLRK